MKSECRLEEHIHIRFAYCKTGLGIQEHISRSVNRIYALPSERRPAAQEQGHRENEGLVELNLIHGFTRISNEEAWDTVCNSLKRHPTLQVLKLWRSIRPLGAAPFPPLAPPLLASRIQTLVDMLKVNMSIHTIRLSDCYCEHELFQGSVIPQLETNSVPCQDSGTSPFCCSYRCK
jgi:hypothetical protein